MKECLTYQDVIQPSKFYLSDQFYITHRTSLFHKGFSLAFVTGAVLYYAVSKSDSLYIIYHTQNSFSNTETSQCPVLGMARDNRYRLQIYVHCYFIAKSIIAESQLVASSVLNECQARRIKRRRAVSRRSSAPDYCFSLIDVINHACKDRDQYNVVIYIQASVALVDFFSRQITHGKVTCYVRAFVNADGGLDIDLLLRLCTRAYGSLTTACLTIYTTIMTYGEHLQIMQIEIGQYKATVGRQGA